jgi:hypothetical protein
MYSHAVNTAILIAPLYTVYTMNQKIITATMPILVLLLGVGVGQAKAWDEGGGGGCCFAHYWHHYWFHHWGCGYSCGIGDFNSFQSQCCQPCCQSDDYQQPSTQAQESNQGTTVNVVNSPGATVNTYQSAASIIQPIVRGLCALTQVDCNSGQVGYQGP